VLVDENTKALVIDLGMCIRVPYNSPDLAPGDGPAAVHAEAGPPGQAEPLSDTAAPVGDRGDRCWCRVRTFVRGGLEA